MEKKEIAPVELSESDAEWPQKFINAKNELEPVVGPYVKTIEHMGSTSIPGIAAKPEIDVLVGLEKLEDVEQFILPLREIGYPYYKRFEENTPDRRYFRKSDGMKPLIHVHMYESESDSYKKHIFFRDYLRAHPEVAKAYEDLKKHLIVLSRGDRVVYQEGKKEFINNVLENMK